jgi:hypothetical protein
MQFDDPKKMFMSTRVLEMCTHLIYKQQWVIVPEQSIKFAMIRAKQHVDSK